MPSKSWNGSQERAFQFFLLHPYCLASDVQLDKTALNKREATYLKGEKVCQKLASKRAAAVVVVFFQSQPQFHTC